MPKKTAVMLAILAATLIINACRNDPVSNEEPAVYTGTVERAELPVTNDFVDVYEITWTYDSGTNELSLAGKLKSINESVKLQGMSIYLMADGVMVGDGAGFLSFIHEKDGVWETAAVMRWWLTVARERKPSVVEMYSELRIWLDETGKQRQTQQTELLGRFSLQ